MTKKHQQKPVKIISCRNNKVTVFTTNVSKKNLEVIANNLGYLDSFEKCIEGCAKYPLTLKPFLLERINTFNKNTNKKWN